MSSLSPPLRQFWLLPALIMLVRCDSVRASIEAVGADCSVLLMEHWATVCAAIALAGLLCAVAGRWLGKRPAARAAAPRTRSSAAAAEAAVANLFRDADEEQVRMMAEECILVDENDCVVGHASKKDCHLNVNIDRTAQGMLHRAFSVFIFDSEGSLLMQQRAASKITFPHYWANTCCSHPLFVADELEEADGMGVKRAAQRKLQQELGIAPEDAPLSAFHRVTRVHYKARSDDVWGEHEVDHILFVTLPCPRTAFRVEPNPNEVAEARWFSQRQLREWVSRSVASGDLISPWFRAIEAYRLHQWWDALKAGNLDSVTEPDHIHRVASSDAATAVSASASAGAAKQGAYGRVRVHKPSTLATLCRPREAWACLRYLMGGGLGGGPVAARAGSPAQLVHDFDVCNDFLTKVSRSFAAVIQQLPEELRRAVCLFYLVLRGLDTVEDDTAVQTPLKKRLLLEFHTHLHAACDPNARPDAPLFTLTGIGAGDERALLERFDSVVRAFAALHPHAREVIADITRRMGAGMAEFAGRDLGEGVDTVKEYDLYCHYVAGLVGEGLSRLFSQTGLEAASVAHEVEMANDMGLFLQKTNIIRDYLEDLVEGRTFWPRQVWGEHTPALANLALPQHRPQALACLNHMVLDAMRHAPQCLRYLAQLRDPAVFRFCAIPQLMAIATLCECLNNPRVFTGVVKIRKGLCVRMLSDCKDMRAVHAWFHHFATRMARTVPNADPNAASLRASVRHLVAITAPNAPVHSNLPARAADCLWRPTAVAVGTAVSGAVLAACLAYLGSRARVRNSFFPKLTETFDVAVLTIAFAAIVYMLSFCGVPIVQDSMAATRRPSESKDGKAAHSSAGMPAALAATAAERE